MEDVEMSSPGTRDDPLNSFGFAAVADFVTSDPDHESFIFRKFNKLAARNLINMQNELMYLERQQEVLDREAMFSDDDVLGSAMMNYDEFRENLKSNQSLQERKELQEEIEQKLDKYHNALLLQRELAKLERPSPLATKTYREAIFGASKYQAKIAGCSARLLDEEYQRDLVALNSPIDRDILSRLIRTYWPFSGPLMNYHDKARTFEERSLVFLVRLCSTAIAAVLLIGSILTLYFVHAKDARLALVIAFVVLFAIGLSLCTAATRDSIFAGTAAYAAVLIVFVSGNLSSSEGGRPNT